MQSPPKGRHDGETSEQGKSVGRRSTSRVREGSLRPLYRPSPAENAARCTNGRSGEVAPQHRSPWRAAAMGRVATFRRGRRIPVIRCDGEHLSPQRRKLTFRLTDSGVNFCTAASRLRAHQRHSGGPWYGAVVRQCRRSPRAQKTLGLPPRSCVKHHEAGG